MSVLVNAKLIQLVGFCKQLFYKFDINVNFGKYS